VSNERKKEIQKERKEKGRKEGRKKEIQMERKEKGMKERKK
jgi:hypothetical protein